MIPVIVINRTLNPLIIEFHLGFKITDEAVFVKIQDGKIIEEIENSFQNLNKRGGFLLGRIASLKGITEFNLQEYSVGITIEKTSKLSEIKDQVMEALIFVIPPKLRHGAAIFMDEKYYLGNKYYQSLVG